MPTTPKYGFRYPALADPADVPTDMSKLALDVEAAGPLGWWATPNFTVPGTIYSQPSAAGNGYIYRPAAAGGVSFYSIVQGETNPRFYFDSNGFMLWGPGGATAVDTNLYRAAAANLKTDGRLDVAGDIYAQANLANYVGLGSIGPGGQPALRFGADTNLYRAAADTLRTDDNFVAGQNLTGGGYLWQQVDGVPGRIAFGSAADTYLYRFAANFLATAGNFMANGQAAGQISLQAPSGLPTVFFGNAQDTNLYRSAANALATDGGFRAHDLSAWPTGAGGIAFLSYLGGENQDRFRVYGDGKLSWGSGTAQDTTLYRAGAGDLRTDGFIRAGVGAGLITLGATAGVAYIYFGGALDTNLYRSAAGNLKTDGAIRAGQSLLVDEANGGFSLYFGSALDTWLSRYAASTVQVHNNLYALGYIQTVGSLYIGGDTTLARGAANVIDNYSGSWGTHRAAAFSVQSDRKTKTDIEQAEPLHEQLLGAGVYRYRRDDTEEKHLGLMADELPDDVVTHGHGPGAESEMGFVDLYKLSTALLATVQHLNERISALEGA